MKKMIWFFMVISCSFMSTAVIAGDCVCRVIGSGGADMGSYRECKNSISQCRSWCENTYNPGGVFRTAISYGSGSCPASCGNIYVRPHVEFSSGKEWNTCTKYKLAFQEDGNLVVYNGSGKAVWASNTEGKGGRILAMQSDGNLVIYTASYKPVWSSKTHGNYGSVLVVQDDGNVVIYDASDKPIWNTKTNGK